MAKWLKVSLGVLALALVGMQLVRFDRTTPTVDPSQDFLTAVNAPPEMATLIRAACYDCHSYQTTYPWYAQVAPASFLVDNHVREGREHLNFSIWGAYSLEKQAHKLEECAEEVAEGKMPESSYTWLHPTARLDEVQAQALAQWFDALKRTVSSMGSRY